MLSHAAVITGNESEPLKQTETSGVRLPPSVEATPPADSSRQGGMSPVLPPGGTIIGWPQAEGDFAGELCCVCISAWGAGGGGHGGWGHNCSSFKQGFTAV